MIDGRRNPDGRHGSPAPQPGVLRLTHIWRGREFKASRMTCGSLVVITHFPIGKI